MRLTTIGCDLTQNQSFGLYWNPTSLITNMPRSRPIVQEDDEIVNDQITQSKRMPPSNAFPYLPFYRPIRFSSKILQENLSKSPFFRLPLELRIEIYQYVFGQGDSYHLNLQLENGHWKWISGLCHKKPWDPEFGPYPDDQLDDSRYIKPCASSHCFYVRPGRPEKYTFGTNLFKSCRQVFMESIYYFYSTKTFIIWHERTLHRLPRLISNQGFSCIKSLEIVLECAYYWRTPRIKSRWEKGCALPDTDLYEDIWNMLANMESLECLRVFLSTDKYDKDFMTDKILDENWFGPIEQVVQRNLSVFELMLCDSWFQSEYIQKRMIQVGPYVLAKPNSSLRIFQWIYCTSMCRGTWFLFLS